MLHRDPPKRVRHRTDQYDSRKDRAEILDHDKKDFLSAEAALAMDDFFLDFCHTDDSRNEKTGGNGSNWHHYGVCQEVEEIQELHSDDLYKSEWSISK